MKNGSRIVRVAILPHVRLSFVFLLLGVLMLTGCSQATLIVQANPTGATITEKGGGLSLSTPAVIKYDSITLSQFKNNQGCYLVRGFDAIWPDGSTGTTGDLVQLCGSANGEYSIIIEGRLHAEVNRNASEVTATPPPRPQSIQTSTNQSPARVTPGWMSPMAWNKVVRGMSEAQVISLLGNPSKRDVYAGSVTLFYNGFVPGSGQVAGRVSLFYGQVTAVFNPVF